MYLYAAGPISDLALLMDRKEATEGNITQRHLESVGENSCSPVV